MRKVLFLAIAGMVAVAARAWADDWPQLQHDAQRSGRTADFVNPNNISTTKNAKWVWVDETHVTANFHSTNNQSISYPARRSVILAGCTQPVVVADRVFFGATNGDFYALNAATGATLWKKQLGGAVLHTAACVGGTVVTGCMDGKVYAFNAATGADAWATPYQTGGGICVAPLVTGGTVYLGSRDGKFYALDLATGAERWTPYRTLAASPADPHSGAPILQPACSDGTNVYFGAENMYFYALDASTGAEVWRRKLGGQSYWLAWPMVDNGRVMTFVMVPEGNSEFLMESVLDSLPNSNVGETREQYAARIWAANERPAIRSWLSSNPLYRNFYVMNTSTGADAYASEPPMGRVGGIGSPNRAPVLDNAGRILLYWRVRSGTVMTGGTFGSKYTPDVSAMDPATGDRVWLTGAASPFGPELDNTFMLTVGGNYLYLNNHMRGAHCINLTNGSTLRITSICANWDGADFRGWGNQLIWWGNDSTPTVLPPPSVHRSPQGDCGVVIATVGGVPTLFIQESGHYQIDFGCLAAVQ
jgi:outer membrane protein assembly factor BamB